MTTTTQLLTPTQTPTHTRTSSCTGHCRAQRFAMDSWSSQAYEAEKAAITSYEDGWDRWDGPIWPWRHTNIPQSSQNLENEWAGCCVHEDDVVVEEVHVPEQRNQSQHVHQVGGLVGEFFCISKTVYGIEANIVAEKIIQKAKNAPEVSVKEVPLTPPAEEHNVCLWGMGCNAPCDKCGRVVSAARL